MINNPLVQGVLAVVLFTGAANAGEKLLFKNLELNTGQQAELLNTLQQHNISGTEATRHYVIQFKNKISAQDKFWLSQVADILRYVPDDAYLVRLKEGASMDQLSGAQVQATIPYASVLKIDEAFPPRSVFTQNQATKMLVSVTQPELLSGVASKLEGAEVLWLDGKYLVIEAPLGLVDQFAQVDGIEWLQPYFEPQTMALPMDGEADSENQFQGDVNNLTGFESGTKIMNFAAAWEKGLDGEGQLVAMADTGLDTGDENSVHEDFRGQVVGGQVFGLFSRSWSDPMGHGTHVAGSVMGNGARSNQQIRGGAFSADMLAQGMWSPLLRNLSVPPELKKLFRKAYAEGARIHTNSWGSAASFGSYDNMAQMTDEYMWDNPDMLIIFAAGNSGEDRDRDGRIDENSIGSPGTSKNILTVGASENLMSEGGVQKMGKDFRDSTYTTEPLASDRPSDNPDGLANFSSRGPTDDRRLKPEVVAPGTNVVSLCSSLEGSSDLWGRFNDDYCFSGGTSMSTPLVAGAAAVIRQYLKQDHGMNNPSASLVKNILMHTSTDMFPGQFGFRENGQELLEPAPNNDEGYGRVNVAAAIDQDQILKMVDETTGVSDGGTKEYRVNVAGASSVKVTLVYTDAPGTPSAARTLVNDLDLIVMDGSRTIEMNDSINNHEQIIMTGMDNDTITVKVKAESIPVAKNGALPFALLVTKQ